MYSRFRRTLAFGSVLLLTTGVALAERPSHFVTPPPSRLLGRYHVGAQLGQGYHARVFRARTSDGTRAVVRAVRSRDQVARENEVLTALRGSPHFAALLDTHEEDGQFYSVQTELAGAPIGLGTRMSIRPRTPSQAVRIALNVLRGLRDLHAAGYLHGDIAPQNIMMDPEAGSATVRIIDVGGARRLQRGSVEKIAYGTPGIRSPEQARADRGYPSSDLYNVARIVVGMLAPSLGDEPTEASAEAWNAANRRDLGHVQNEQLRAVLSRALAHDPHARYSSAQELIDALRPFSRD